MLRRAVGNKCCEYCLLDWLSGTTQFNGKGAVDISTRVTEDSEIPVKPIKTRPLGLMIN